MPTVPGEAWLVSPGEVTGNPHAPSGHGRWVRRTRVGGLHEAWSGQDARGPRRGAAGVHGWIAGGLEAPSSPMRGVAGVYG